MKREARDDIEHVRNMRNTVSRVLKYLNSALRLLGPLIALWWAQPIIGVTAVAGQARLSARTPRTAG